MEGTPDRHRSGVGWDVVAATAQAAAEVFGARLAAVYALGSLAHGGFAPLVSDVDVAVVLDDFDPSDTGRVDAVVTRVRGSGLALAERLSLFWAPVAALSGGLAEGRFPPLDRLDLVRHGVLVLGRDARSGVAEPTVAELVQGAAEFAVDVLGLAQRRGDIVDAARTVGGGARPASKVALFPVRFLYTARTGHMGLVDEAVANYLSTAPAGPRRDLVRAAAGWRHRWSEQDVTFAATLLRHGTVPLYREFVDDYVPRLEQLGCHDLARRLAGWGDSLRVAG